MGWRPSRIEVAKTSAVIGSGASPSTSGSRVISADIVVRDDPRTGGDSMRAALMVEAKKPFVVEDIDYYAPSPGRVLVRTGASPFCSTDCVNWRGELSKIPPTVLGHASMGVVEEVGANVSDVKVGDKVIVPGTSECNVCFYCSIGRPDQCSETFDRGGIWPDVAERSNGDVVNAAGNVGGYSEMMNVTANQVWAIESDLPDEWLGC